MERIDGSVYAEAIRKARGCVKDEIRASGRKLLDFAASELTKAAKSYLTAHPELIAKAAADVAAWRGSKLKTSTQKRSR